jgi:hypothetical protein
LQEALQRIAAHPIAQPRPPVVQNRQYPQQQLRVR